MEDNSNSAHNVLTVYLNEHKLRKTPERYAILDAVCSFNGHFSLQQLSERMEEQYFRVSRATLYNTMELLLKVPLVVSHSFSQHTVYESSYLRPNHCHQICKICGKVTELSTLQVETVIESMKMKRFHKESFTLDIYGICSTCNAKLNRKRKKSRETEAKSATRSADSKTAGREKRNNKSNNNNKSVK